LSFRQALRYLGQILANGGPGWIAADANWSKLASESAALVRAPRFSWLMESVAGSSAAAPVEDILPLLRSLSREEALEKVTGILIAELARVLRGSAARVEPDRPLADLGMDSLMAVELLTAVETRFHVQITSLEIMGGATVAQVAGRIAAHVLAGKHVDDDGRSS
jgi:acyl carrier protein